MVYVSEKYEYEQTAELALSDDGKILYTEGFVSLLSKVGFSEEETRQILNHIYRKGKFAGWANGDMNEQGTYNISRKI